MALNEKQILEKVNSRFVVSNNTFLNAYILDFIFEYVLAQLFQTILRVSEFP